MTPAIKSHTLHMLSLPITNTRVTYHWAESKLLTTGLRRARTTRHLWEVCWISQQFVKDMLNLFFGNSRPTLGRKRKSKNIKQLDVGARQQIDLLLSKLNYSPRALLFKRRQTFNLSKALKLRLWTSESTSHRRSMALGRGIGLALLPIACL